MRLRQEAGDLHLGHADLLGDLLLREVVEVAQREDPALARRPSFGGTRGTITPEMMEKLCQPPSADLPQQPLAFPYEFPKPGRYRLWGQVKISGVVRTGVFDTEVSERRTLVSN